MIDIKKQIADVLREHQLTDHPTWANERECACGETVHVMLPSRSYVVHLAEVLAGKWMEEQQ